MDQDLLELETRVRFRYGEEGGAASRGDLRELLAFRLANEEYALDIGVVEEIITPRPITEVPLTPDFILGLLSLRGRIVPVFDLRRRLSLAAAPLSRDSRIIIAAEGGRIAGLAVDGVSGVVRLPAAAIGPTPAVVGGTDAEFLAGLGRADGRLLILLNLGRVLEFATDVEEAD
ncbi:MAG TPA: chemotaxis protein CheW [Thermodesulfobacteriota bacterium]|nr:chemotaxis protein CheW [Thermodesulfobacteriota bacterium]